MAALLWSDGEEEREREEREKKEEENIETRDISPSIIHEMPSQELLISQKPLEGVVAFVDVRTGTNSSINTGPSLHDTLTVLGATVANRMTKNVTHIIYKDGKYNLDRVDTKNLFLVNPLWLDACKHSNVRVSEAKYPISDVGGVTPGGMSGFRLKRMRSMQPKPFEEEIVRSVERRKKARLLEKQKRTLSPLPLSSPFDFHDSDNDCTILEDPNSRESTPDSLPPVNFTPKQTKLDIETSTKKLDSLKKPHPQRPHPQTAQSKVSPLKEKNHDLLPKVGKTNKSTVKVKVKPPKKCSVSKEVKPVQRVLLTRKTRKSASKGITSKETKRKKEEKEMAADLVEEKRVEEKQVKEEGEGEEKGIVKRVTTKKRRSFEKPKPSIVMTSVSKKDQDIVHVIVSKLGVYELVHTITDTTTHVICGAVRRTVNVLAGTAKGCWMLPMDWVLKSLEAGHWLPEEAFEMTTEFPSAQFFRLERQERGVLYKPSLFTDIGSVYVSANTKPPQNDIQLLLTLTGAKLTNSKLKANVIIGRGEEGEEERKSEDKVHVTESWILDSITAHSRLPFDSYLIENIQT